MEIKQIPLGSHLDENYIEFINQYRGHRTNLNAYNWQFSHKPDKTVITGIVKEGQVCGTQCMMPMDVLIGEEIKLSGKCENSYLDKSLRGKGVFGNMFTYATDLCDEYGIKLLWAFTPALKPYAKLGFSIYEDCLRSSLLHINIPSIGKYFKGRRGMQLIKGILSYIVLVFSVLKIKSLLNTKKTTITVSNELRSNHSLESIQREMGVKYPKNIQLSNSKRYVDWRISNNPNLKIDKLYFYKNTNLIGYCFYSIKNSRVHIRALIYAQEDNAEELISALIREFSLRDIDSFLFEGNYENPYNQKIFHVIKKLSFRKISTAGWNFVYKFSDDKYMDKIKKEDWLINNLWTEGY